MKAVLIYGQDNLVDKAVLEVLIRKAWRIHRQLGVYVPIPLETESVIEAIVTSLLSESRKYRVEQLSLFGDSGTSGTREFHEFWDRAVERERARRTKFAQYAIKPDEVAKELEETDRVLGSPEEVKAFLREASQRVGFTFYPFSDSTWVIDTSSLPQPLRERIRKTGEIRVSFSSPPPEGTMFLGRSHPLVEGLSEYIMDTALYPPPGETFVSRCGAIRTGSVSLLTTLYLLRVRYLLHERGKEVPALAEEVFVWGVTGYPSYVTPLPIEKAQDLFERAHPEENLSDEEKEEVVREALQTWEEIDALVESLLTERAASHEETQKRIRRLLRERAVRFEPQFPPDLLGILVLLPIPGTMRG
ncbi:MAG: hypothetical protein D6713_08155 [Deltaproteobacteria bacterium]|nr:MAG: hypothetical protein D6713_08155 [Deltaproteobacteria bacterium]